MHTAGLGADMVYRKNFAKGNKMKITWIVNNINQIGGIEQVVCGLSNYFSKSLGHQVEIISINTNSEATPFFYIEESVGIRHCGLDWREQNFYKLYRLVSKILTSLDSDVLITCHPTISNAVLLNKKRFNGKIVVTQHSANDSFTKKRLLCNAFMFRMADAFVVLTETDRKLYEALKCPVRIIPNANFKLIHNHSTLNEKIILAAGRIETVKGFDILIDAFFMLANKYPDWNLCICGSGSEEKQLKKQISARHLSDRVLLPGAVKNIDEYMCNASVFALSSRSEGFSLVLIEAMSHGLPIVSFNLPAVQEICKGKGGLVAKQRDAFEFASELDKMLASDALRQKLGGEGIELSKKYSVASISELWMELFQELLI